MKNAFPDKVALATDLSHRCDRALDRAVLIAKEWHASLLVIHALEQPVGDTVLGGQRELPSWRRPPDPVRAQQSDGGFGFLEALDAIDRLLDRRVESLDAEAGAIDASSGKSACQVRRQRPRIHFDGVFR